MARAHKTYFQGPKAFLDANKLLCDTPYYMKPIDTPYYMKPMRSIIARALWYRKKEFCFLEERPKLLINVRTSL